MKPSTDQETERTSYVYMVECRDGSLYTGWTTDAMRRVRTHNRGNGAKYTRSRLPVTLVYLEKTDSKNSALQREAAIKRLSPLRKKELIKSETNLVNSYLNE